MFYGNIKRRSKSRNRQYGERTTGSAPKWKKLYANATGCSYHRDAHPYQLIILVECALVKCVLCIQSIRNAQDRAAPYESASSLLSPVRQRGLRCRVSVDPYA